MGRIEVQVFKCDRCGHIWMPREAASKLDNLDANLPKVCPKCKSPYWDIPKKRRTTKS